MEKRSTVVKKKRCTGCQVLTANAGQVCTYCLDRKDAAQKGAATVRLLKGEPMPQDSRCKRLGTAYRMLRILKPRHYSGSFQS